MEIAPFCWESLPLVLDGHYSILNLASLHDWFVEWFDQDDKNSPDENGLRNVVHFLSDPVSDKGQTALEIDFGSASATAFEELLDALSSCGVSKAYLGNSSTE